MAELDKMIDGGVNAGGVIEQDGAGLGIVELELCEDDGHVAVDELIEDRLFFAEGHDGDALDLALQHSADAGGEDDGIAVGRADQNLVAVGDGDLFKALNEFGKEGVGDVFNDDAEEAAAAGDEGAGVGVGEVIQLLDGLPDALGEALADQRRAVDGSGDGGDGDLGQGRDGTDVGRFGRSLAGGFSRHEPILFERT